MFLPFAVDYQPYAAPYVVQTVQLLIGIILAFCLILKELSVKATITLDTDWFYRRPSQLAYSLFCRVSVLVVWCCGKPNSSLRRICQ